MSCFRGDLPEISGIVGKYSESLLNQQAEMFKKGILEQKHKLSSETLNWYHKDEKVKKSRIKLLGYICVGMNTHYSLGAGHKLLHFSSVSPELDKLMYKSAYDCTNFLFRLSVFLKLDSTPAQNHPTLFW